MHNFELNFALNRWSHLKTNLLKVHVSTTGVGWKALWVIVDITTGYWIGIFQRAGHKYRSDSDRYGLDETCGWFCDLLWRMQTWRCWHTKRGGLTNALPFWSAEVYQ